MEKLWKKSEAWYKKYNKTDELPVKAHIVLAFEAGWKAGQRATNLNVFSLGFISGLLFFGLCLAIVLAVVNG